MQEQPNKLFYHKDEVEELKTASYWAGVLSMGAGVAMLLAIAGYVLFKH